MDDLFLLALLFVVPLFFIADINRDHERVPLRLRPVAFWLFLALSFLLYLYVEFVVRDYYTACLLNAFTLYVVYQHVTVSHGRLCIKRKKDE